MKKRLLICFILCLNLLCVVAQQKIKDNSTGGSNLPDQNAVPELESSNKGLLYTRVALENTGGPSPLSAHVAGMMVYNDGTKWIFGKGGPGATGLWGPRGLTGPEGARGTDGIGDENQVRTG